MRLRFFLVACVIGPGTVSAQSLPEQVLELVNIQRWNNGQLAPLKGQAQLDAASTLHSTNMGVRNFFMHCDPDTMTSPGNRMAAAGYAAQSWAENIAAGSATAAGVMDQWMNSSGHRANILSTANNEIGIGYYFDAVDTGTKRTSSTGSCTPNGTISGNFAHYWTQNFGRRANHYPVVIAREAWRTTSCSVAVYLHGQGFATQMRFSTNGGATWSAWEAFATNTTRTLSGANGSIATLDAEIRNASGTVRSASDTIRLGTSCSGGTVPAQRVFASGFEN